MSDTFTQNGAETRALDAAEEDRPPLVEFDTAGRAAVISYALPESVSYSGRRLVDLGFKGADFVDFQPGAAESAALSRPDLARALTRAASVATPADAVAAPQSVVLTPSDDGDTPVVDEAVAPFPCSRRLTELTWKAVQAIAAAGKRVEIYRSMGGALDYRVREAPRPAVDAAPASLAAAKPPVDNGDGGGFPVEPPSVDVEITSPTESPQPLKGPITVTVTGAVVCFRTSRPTVVVKLDNGAPADVPVAADGTFSLPLTLDRQKQYTITAGASAQQIGGQRMFADTASVSIDVEIPTPTDPVVIAPTVTVTEPKGTMLVRTDTGTAACTLEGEAKSNGGNGTLNVRVEGGPNDTGGAPAVESGKWKQVVELEGYGDHTITVSCVNGAGTPAPPVTVKVRLVERVPSIPIDRRLFLVETIAISSFLGDYGAGRLLKSLSVMPKERVTMQIESYRKDEATERAAQSILDSTGSESASDFEQSLNEEQNRRASDVTNTSLSLAADVGLQLGVAAKVSLKSNYTQQANSTREQSTKDVRNALEKHAMKASANRSVTVNNEYSSKTETGTKDDTKREFENINASRVLNFVCRQMVQEHLCVVHLVDVKVAYYEQDVLLDAEGNAVSIDERYTEHTLPQFADLGASVLVGGELAARDAQAKLQELLMSVANADGKLLPLVEVVIPTKDGQPLPDESYLRVNPKRQDTWRPRGQEGPLVKVPGIALSRQQLVLRTDGVLVEAILGEGEALDEYSRDLQAITIDERQIAVDRERLAQQIVASGNEQQAALFAKVFAPIEPATEE